MAKESFAEFGGIPEVIKKVRVLFDHKRDLLPDPESSSSDDSDCSSSGGSDFSDDRINLHQLQRRKKENEKTVLRQNSKMTADKNAHELLEQEEREKKKAEKRRAKKKRLKEKKKAEREKENRAVPNKDDNQNKRSSDKHNKSIKSSDGGSAEEEFLDPTAAFVAVAVNKKKKNTNVSQTNVDSKPKASQVKKNSINDEKDPVLLDSERLAVRGNMMASMGQFEDAVTFFSKAIQLVPDDHRFYGNRSFCFCQMEQFDKALKDAEKAIALAPQGPKGYFRQGEALRGLKLYKEAERAFEKVIKLDTACTDARQELENVQLLQLIEMGFNEERSTAAVKTYKNVQAAVEALMAEDEPSSLGGEIYYSDEEVEDIFTMPVVRSQTGPDTKMDPANPEGHTSLWVGNVAQDVTEKQLTDMFAKFGAVHSVRVLPEKYCAFINFKDKNSPGLAMRHLQHKEVSGEKLLIRYPDNPVGEAMKKSKPTLGQQAQAQAQAKQTGPVNGDECHFWRTTGCLFGPNCRYRHIKENKGIDKKPWQKAS